MIAPATTTSRRRAAARAARAPGAARRNNVGEAERWASTLGGGALALLGLSRGSLAGLGLAALGGALIHRGLTGHCAAYAALGLSTAGPHSPQASIPAGHGVKVEESVTLLADRGELYR